MVENINVFGFFPFVNYKSVNSQSSLYIYIKLIVGMSTGFSCILDFESIITNIHFVVYMFIFQFSTILI